MRKYRTATDFERNSRYRGRQFRNQRQGESGFIESANPLSIQCNVEVFGFYVPHRHAYGDDWIDFIKQGVDENITFDTETFTEPVYSMGQTEMNGTVPAWMKHGYDSIWRRYFIDPTEPVDLEEYSIIDNEFFPDTDNENARNSRLFGARTLFPLRFWSGGIFTTTTDDDHKVNLTDGNTKFDIIDLEKIKMRYRTEQVRDWFDRRYKDILQGEYGTTVNIDADERPELLFRSKTGLDGKYVDGTDDATLGNRKGFAEGSHQFRMPRKFFDEHGAVWIMMLLRFPSIHQDEYDRMVHESQPSYMEIAGNHDLLMAEPPISMDASDFILNGGENTLGVFPYGKWYREKAANIHPLFKQARVHPFIRREIAQANRGRYISDQDYKDIFLTTQYGQWQAKLHMETHKFSSIPNAQTSIFAGV